MGSLRAWWPFITVFLAVAAEMVVAGLNLGAGARPAVITALFAFTTIAVVTSLSASMGLAREGLGLRLVAAVPLVLSLGVGVVLMLEAGFHRGARLPGGP
ncbi:MAG: hypothetical protein ABUS79_06840 [Pseudomonadota bacterium]